MNVTASTMVSVLLDLYSFRNTCHLFKVKREIVALGLEDLYPKANRKRARPVGKNTNGGNVKGVDGWREYKKDANLTGIK